MSFLQKANDLYQRIIAKNYFFTAFILLWVYYILLYPCLSYLSEVFAEHGSNYFYYAYYKSFSENIWQDDAGYLVWLPRLIALAVSAASGPYWFIYITNFIALACVAFFVSFMNHSGFRGILQDDRQRFLLSLLLGMIIVPSLEVLSYTNFSYTGFFFIAFLVFLDKNRLKKPEYIFYSLLCCLLCISKFHFTLFFPIFLALIIRFVYKKEWHSALFYLPSMITIMIQIIYVLCVSGARETGFVPEFTSINSGFMSTVMKASRGFAFWTTAYATHFRFLGGGAKAYAFVSQILGILCMIALFYLALINWKNKILSRQSFLFFLFLNFLSICFGMVSSLSLGSGIKEAFLENSPYPLGRRWFISYDMVWLSVVILLLNLRENQKYGRSIFKAGSKLYSLILLIFLSLSFCVTFPKIYTSARIPSKNPARISDWRNLSSLLNNEYFFIPVEPHSWGYRAGIQHRTALAQSFSPLEGAIPIGDSQDKIVSLIVKYPDSEDIYAMAYNTEIPGETASLVSGKEVVYKYLVFPKPVSADKIVLFHADHSMIENVDFVAIYTFSQEN